MPYNLGSPQAIRFAVNLDDLRGWFAREISDIPPSERVVIEAVAHELGYFARWPLEALVFMPGSVRSSKNPYHTYPAELKLAYKMKTGFVLDTRPNGPAIAAFIYSGGERPSRMGSTNAWSVHHVYNGKFPYIQRAQTLHAVKDAEHFTNSAGLIAAHPILDTMVDEYPAFAWLLRAEAFLRFGYDPDHVF